MKKRKDKIYWFGSPQKIELKSYLTDLRMVCNLEVARCLSCHNQVDKAVDFPLDIHQHAPDPNSERIDIINISVITSAMYSAKLEGPELSTTKQFLQDLYWGLFLTSSNRKSIWLK